MGLKKKKKPKYRNKFERKISRQLQRVPFKYESEKVPYVLCCHYIPDFIVSTPLGKLYIECKGYLRNTDKRKLAAVRKQHPELDIRIVFYASTRTSIKWAEKTGIRYAVGMVPKEWLEGL